VEDYGWLEPARQPQRRDVVLVDPELFAATGGGGGGLEGAADEHLDAAAQAENFLVRMLSGAGTGTRYCAGATVSDRAARAAAAYWLLRKEPATGPGGEQPDERARQLWHTLQALPEQQAAQRVAALREASAACTGGLAALLVGGPS